MSKEQIVKKFNTLTEEELKKDFFKLRETDVSDLFSRVGSKVVNNYTLKERLDTKGNKGITFFEVYKNRKELAKKDYIKNILKYYGVDYTDDIKIWKNISTLYFGVPHIFRPIIAMNICCAVLSTTTCYAMLTLPFISVGTLLHRSVNIMKPKSLFIQNVAVGSLTSLVSARRNSDLLYLYIVVILLFINKLKRFSHRASS
jgi:hypothetical protein